MSKWLNIVFTFSEQTECQEKLEGIACKAKQVFNDSNGQAKKVQQDPEQLMAKKQLDLDLVSSCIKYRLSTSNVNPYYLHFFILGVVQLIIPMVNIACRLMIN